MSRIVPEDFHVPEAQLDESKAKESLEKELTLIGSNNWSIWDSKASLLNKLWGNKEYIDGSKEICRNFLSRGRLISDSNEIVSVCSSLGDRGIIVKISEVPHEGIVSLRCTNEILKDIPNFPRCYGVFRGGAPVMTFKGLYYSADENTPDDNSPSFYILTEYIRGSSELGEDEDIFPMALAQAIFAVMYANSKFGYVHNDMHTMNVIVMCYDKEQYVPVYVGNKKRCLKTNICSFLIDSQFSSYNDSDLGNLSFAAEGVSFNTDGSWIVDIVRLILHGHIIMKDCYGAEDGDSRLKLLEDLWTFFSDKPITDFKEYEDIFFSMPDAGKKSKSFSKKDFCDKVVKACGLNFEDVGKKKNEMKKINGSCFDDERGFREYELPDIDEIKREIYFLPRKKTYNLPCCRRLIYLYMELLYTGASEKRLSKIFNEIKKRYRTLGPWGMDDYLADSYQIIDKREELKKVKSVSANPK